MKDYDISFKRVFEKPLGGAPKDKIGTSLERIFRNGLAEELDEAIKQLQSIRKRLSNE